MTSSTKVLLQIYSIGLQLYPSAFRARYGDELLEAARQDAAAAGNKFRFGAVLAWDMAQSVAREHWRLAPPVTGQTAFYFALFFTAILLVVAFISQQMIRSAADRGPERLLSRLTALSHPPLAMADTADEITSEAWLESGASFAVMFDNNGRATAGTANFNGQLPRLPQGLFDTVRAHGRYKVSWQPNRKVRIALVGQSLPSGGFVFAGASLRHSEMQRRQLQRFLAILWSAMLMAVGAIVATFHRKDASAPHGS